MSLEWCCRRGRRHISYTIPYKWEKWKSGVTITIAIVGRVVNLLQKMNVVEKVRLINHILDLCIYIKKMVTCSNHV